MKKITLILLLLPCCLLAQNRYADSMEKVLAATKPDTQKVKILNRLANDFSDTALNKSMAYLNRALLLSRQINFGKGEADALAIRGHVEVNQLKNDLAKADFKTAILFYKKNKYYRSLAYAYINWGMLLRPGGNIAESLAYFQQAADIFEKVNDLDGSSDAVVLLANNYNSIGEYDKALAEYKKSYELRIKIHDTNKAAQALAGMGITYTEKQAKAKDDVNFKQAVKYFTQAREVFVKLNNKLNTAFIDKEIAKAYGAQKDYQNALVYLLESESKFNEIGYKRELGELYKETGNTYVNLKNYTKAKFYLYKALRTSIAQNYLQFIAGSYAALYNYYKKTGDASQALYYHERYSDAQDSLTARTNFKKQSEMTAKYETEKKEQQINILNKENTIQKLSISSRNKTISIIASLFVITVIVVALFFYRSKLKERAHQLKQQNMLTEAIVDAEENERKRIASDLHDGVGQLFSAVKMNLNGLFERISIPREEDRFLAENTLALVDESCKEVRTISHQMMPNMLLRSGIASDLKSFI